MIKLRERAQTVKAVSYIGMNFIIPFTHDWIAFNKHGHLFSYAWEPSVSDYREAWIVNDEDNGFLYLGWVETDMYWQDSLQYVGD